MSEYGPGPWVAVDAVVICNEKVLLINRSNGGGYALPGGFVDPSDHSLVHAAARELKEETKLDLIGTNGYKGCVVPLDVKNAKNRDPRGWVITHPVLFILINAEEPIVEGNDDAIHAQWYPFEMFTEYNKIPLFLDHYDIVVDGIAQYTRYKRLDLLKHLKYSIRKNIGVYG